MTFDKTFCSSPWFHMRINNSGSYEYCRWQVLGNTRSSTTHNIRNQEPLDYFQQSMSQVRQQLLAGESPEGCRECYIMEQHKKVSGRQKQLLKTGIQEVRFDKTLLSSKFLTDFEYSEHNQGHTLRTVSDWQIDLGNYCNGACVFCSPNSSSRLALELKKLNIINEIPSGNWCEDPELLQRFINDLLKSQRLKYLHFIGGETLITPAFAKILQALVDHCLSQQITVGFTTNLNTWSDEVVELLKQFDQVNLGMSIETMTRLNDYVRWPNQHQSTKQILDRWIDLANQQGWLIQMRITPSCLTVHELDTVYQFAWDRNLCVESCNFLYKPEFFRIGVLPRQYLDQARHRLNQWIDDHKIDSQEQILNIRNPDKSRQQILQDAESYVRYMESVADETHRLPDLVDYLKRLESSRKNSVLDYLPEYEEIFRLSGY